MNITVQKLKSSNISRNTIILSVIILLGIVGYVFFRPTPKLDYVIETGQIKPGLTELSELTIENNCVQFRIEFQGGGGDNDAARLSQNDHQLIIKLLNSDFTSFKTLLLYRLSGTICGLKPETYILTVMDSNRQIVFEGPFTIREPK